MKNLFAVDAEKKSSKLRFCIMLVGVFLMFAAVSTAQAAPAASGSGSGSSSISAELDTLVGGSMWGGDFGYCDNLNSNQTCSNRGSNTWKLNVEGAILFPVGSGRFSFGPVFGVAYRGETSQTETYTGSVTETYHYTDRINSLFVGGRVSTKLGDRVRVFVEAGPSVNTDRQNENYVSGTSTSKYLYNTTLTAPEEAVGLTYFASKHVGLTVKYERQDIRSYQDIYSSSRYETVIHENGILGGLTFWFGDR